MKKIQKQIIFEVLVNLLFFVLFLSFFRYVLFQPGDDQIFIDLRQRFTLGNFLLTYYNTWSGRVINNFLIYIFARHPIVLWQLFMALILTFFGRNLCSINPFCFLVYWIIKLHSLNILCIVSIYSFLQTETNR